MTELTIDQALQQGVEAHKSGKVQEADRLYTAILKAQPKHPDTNHNMGVLALGVGKVEEALPFFKTALESNPAIAQYWLSYIDTLIKLEQLAEAKSVLDQAKSKGAKGDGFDKLQQRLKGEGEEPLEASKIAAEALPQQPNILESLKLDQAIKLAKKKVKEGSTEEAKRIYQDILTRFPKNKRASNGIRTLAGSPGRKGSKFQDPPKDQIQILINLHSQGQLQQALKQATILLQQFPNSSVLHNICGAVYKGLGQLDASVEAYNKALAIKPDYAEAYYNMGVTLQEQGKLKEAIEAYNKVLAIKPDHAETYYNMGNAFKEQGKQEEAIKTYNEALAIKPNYAEAYYNMGNALKEQDKLAEAVEAYNKAIDIKPNYVESYSNMGVALQEQGNLEEAIGAYNKALDIKPNYIEAYNNASELLKTYSPITTKNHVLFTTDRKIKKISNKLILSESNDEITDILLQGLSYVSEDGFCYKTPFSQIYKRNFQDLNCKRHKKIFDTKNIIPEFCFGCFKVQVEVDTFFDLIRLTSLFYELELEENLTTKTIIELRTFIPGYYKGLIYCRGLDQARKVKILLDLILTDKLYNKKLSQIKRGCSEFPLKFPEYGKIENDINVEMNYPVKWKKTEIQFDQSNCIYPKEMIPESLAGFCLSDFYIFQKWIDYAKGLEEPLPGSLYDRPIIFPEIHNVAKLRRAKFGKLF